MQKGGVGVFDSGIGGLTVLNECQKLLPDTLFYYYGDNNHAPYGNRSVKEIERLTKKAFRLFRRLKVKAVVIACNTVTAVCIDRLRKRYSFPIIGTEPAVLSAAKKGGEIFALTTRATFESERFRALCSLAQKRYPQARITPYACDGLAGEIERCLNYTDSDFSRFLPQGKPSSVVLGCTHYVYIKEVVQRFYSCDVMDGNYGVATRLSAVLQAVNKDNSRQKRQKNRDLQPHLTTMYKKGKEANKCSCFDVQKSGKNSKEQNVIFLGKSRKINETQYEQMFVVKNGRDMVNYGAKVVKKPKKIKKILKKY